MAYALVSAGTNVNAGGNTALTPAFGVSPTAGNLLICVCTGHAGSASLVVPPTPSGWSAACTALTQNATSASVGIFYKIADGGDSNPTFAATTGVAWAAQCLEFSGNTSLSPLDQTNTASPTATTSPRTVQNVSVDAAAAELVIAATALRYSAAATKTTTSTLNNGATATDSDNDAAAAVNHYNFTYGITTGNAAGDRNSVAFTTTNLTQMVLSIASFNLPGSTTQGLTATTATVTASRQFDVGKTVAVTLPAAVASCVKSVRKTVSANATVAATLAAIKVVLVALTATAATTASSVKSVGKTVTAAATATPTMIRSVGKHLSSTVTATATVATVKSALVAVTATVTAAASITRRVTKSLLATATMSATIDAIRAIGVALTATVSATASISRTVSKVVVAAATVTVETVKSVTETLTASATATAIVVKQIAVALAASVSSTASLAKSIVGAAQTFLVNLTATVTTTAVASFQVALNAIRPGHITGPSDVGIVHADTGEIVHASDGTIS